jgi:hypothetical protein
MTLHGPSSPWTASPGQCFERCERGGLAGETPLGTEWHRPGRASLTGREELTKLRRSAIIRLRIKTEDIPSEAWPTGLA